MIISCEVPNFIYNFVKCGGHSRIFISRQQGGGKIIENTHFCLSLCEALPVAGCVKWQIASVKSKLFRGNGKHYQKPIQIQTLKQCECYPSQKVRQHCCMCSCRGWWYHKMDCLLDKCIDRGADWPQLISNAVCAVHVCKHHCGRVCLTFKMHYAEITPQFPGCQNSNSC